MSDKRNYRRMMKLDDCYKIVQQSGVKGISADDIAEKLGKVRTTVYDYLNSLDLMGKVQSDHGLWRAKTEEQTIKPLEKEIVIELPISKDQWQRMAMLEALAKDCENENCPQTGSIYRTVLEKLNETRIIRIKGKNVDDLDLQKAANLIQEANAQSSKFNLRKLFKNLRRSLDDNSKNETTQKKPADIAGNN